MTDLEMTKLCAEAMGFQWTPFNEIQSECGIGTHRFSNTTTGYWTTKYDPLHDDAQAMALVKKFNLFVQWSSKKVCWVVPFEDSESGPADSDDHEDLNRAIVDCVAKMQEAK